MMEHANAFTRCQACHEQTEERKDGSRRDEKAESRVFPQLQSHSCEPLLHVALSMQNLCMFPLVVGSVSAVAGSDPVSSWDWSNSVGQV